MAKEMKYTDISEIHNVPELVRIAEEVQASKQPRVLTRDGEELVVVQPAVGTRTVKRARAHVLTADDPLSKLVGALASHEPTDASKKHEYLAQTHPAV